MNAGDLYWVEFPAGAGRAQAGKRPALVMQTASVSSSLPTILLVPLTTQIEALRFPGAVLLEADTTNGLTRKSVALVFQLTALDRRFLSTYVGTVSASVMQAVWAALDELTGREHEAD